MANYHILPGSFEFDGKTITGAIHTGAHEWDFAGNNMRYIQGTIPDNPPKDISVVEFLSNIYENSTGCLLVGDFKVNDDG